MNNWTIDELHVDQRLDLFLAEQLPDLSRSAIQKHIKAHGVQVNEHSATVHRFLKLNDKISWLEIKLVPKPSPKRANTVEGPVLEPTIIEETKDWLVINKPAGLLVHPTFTSQEPTLVDWLVKHDPAIGRVGEDPARPGIVHRLDKEVGGLMVVAKTQATYDWLQHQFAQRHVRKYYLALAHGEISKDEDDIKLRIARSSTQARMAARPKEEEEGKAAWTHFRVKERFVGATLLELEILSGRTHQIRAHLHGIGHPIIGDTIYTLRQTDRNVKAPGLMLQSVGLSFEDIDHKQHAFTLPADPMFDVLVQEFRRS